MLARFSPCVILLCKYNCRPGEYQVGTKIFEIFAVEKQTMTKTQYCTGGVFNKLNFVLFFSHLSLSLSLPIWSQYANWLVVIVLSSSAKQLMHIFMAFICPNESSQFTTRHLVVQIWTPYFCVRFNAFLFRSFFLVFSTCRYVRSVPYSVFNEHILRFCYIVACIFGSAASLDAVAVAAAHIIYFFTLCSLRSIL